MELTQETIKRIDFLFSVESRDAVCQLLIKECGNNLPFLEKASGKDLERFQFAALKISNGNFKKLFKAVELAKLDWRDLLLAADFANDIYAHKKWMPNHRRRI